MTAKAPMKDMVVILPGILGSVLQKDGKDLWAVSGQSTWQVLAQSGETIRNLNLAQDDSEAENLGDGIRATALIQDTHLIPGFWKIDDLQPVLYRVRGKPENSSEQAPTRVHDLFEVVRN